MAYNFPFNTATPDGDITPVSDLDTIVQDLKKALNERLDQVIVDFSDDGVDPKILELGTANVVVDLAVNRPATPDREGIVYFESDTQKLFVAADVGAPDNLSWREIIQAGSGSGQLTDITMAYGPHFIHAGSDDDSNEHRLSNYRGDDDGGSLRAYAAIPLPASLSNYAIKKIISTFGSKGGGDSGNITLDINAYASQAGSVTGAALLGSDTIVYGGDEIVQATVDMTSSPGVIDPASQYLEIEIVYVSGGSGTNFEYTCSGFIITFDAQIIRWLDQSRVLLGLNRPSKNGAVGSLSKL